MTLKTILIIGSGGREHALAWSLAKSPQVERVYVAPGNAGTAWPARPGLAQAANIPIAAEDTAALVAFARRESIALTVVGPEGPLAAGVADAFRAAGLAVFGPMQQAARLEASKAFAKDFMRQHHIPTGDYAAFTDYQAARDYLGRLDQPVVIKADGLAAGKGVLICDDRAQAEAALRLVMVEQAFGAAGQTVVIEERLSGPEISILAWCDGKIAVPLLPARDHKRVFNHDEGPNTGGMGAYAPAPDIDAALVESTRRTVLQPVVDGMAQLGTPYVGILYAGLMLTAAGPKVLEFNCRFGDPETQVVLPLLATDHLDILTACVNGTLSQLEVQWRPEACATVVMASPGYPGSYPKGLPISGLEQITAANVLVFHAGTARANGQIVTAGGRVLAVSAVNYPLAAALKDAYAAVAQIHFDQAHYRTDIGAAYQQGTEL